MLVQVAEAAPNGESPPPIQSISKSKPPSRSMTFIGSHSNAAEKLGAAGLAADSLNFVAVAPRALVMLALENPALKRDGCAGVTFGSAFAVLCRLAPLGFPPSLTGDVGGGAPASVGIKPLMKAIA